MQSPLLPWEVIERVIGQSGDHHRTLYSFSLTCNQLRPRALCFMVSDAKFRTRDQIFRFCDFLEDKPYLKPLVRSIAVHPADFAPFPLLHILPNLSKISFVSQLDDRDDHSAKDSDPAEDGFSSKGGPVDESVEVGDSSQNGTASQNHDFAEDDNGHHAQNLFFESDPVVALNQPTLTCCQRFGTRIQTLHLSDLSFSTYLDFARMLLAFTSITHLACVGTVIEAEGNRAHLDVMKQRLSERLHLLTIDIYFLGLVKQDYYDTPSVAALLLDSALVQYTVETLTVHNFYRSNGLSHPFHWPHLRSLVLKLEFTTQDVTDAIVFLKDFPPSVLRDVVAELRSPSIWHMNQTLSDEASSERFKELEQILLRFLRPQIVCSIGKLRDGRQSFWTQEIGKHFPVLLQRGAFTVTVNTGAGHDLDNIAGDLATSPDGKWVATASQDSTIIVWDAADGTIRRHWISHGYKEVSSLAFSPDSRYLLSCGHDSKVKIWDLAEGSRLVATLEGHTDPVTHCAWSPHGDIVASGSYDSTVRLWDARTFHELHVLLNHENEGESIVLTAFSPDGRWLVSGSRLGYCIWNVASGTLHKSFVGDRRPTTPAAAFDPGSTRLLLVQRHVVNLVDVKTGEGLATLTGVDSEKVGVGAWDVAFSPAGTVLVYNCSRVPLGEVYHPGTMRPWDVDLDTYDELFSLEGDDSEKMVLQACFSPCGKYVASASMDGMVRLWRTRDGSYQATFPEHTAPVQRVAFSGDGETLWSIDVFGAVIMRCVRDVLPADE